METLIEDEKDGLLVLGALINRRDKELEEWVKTKRQGQARIRHANWRQKYGKGKESKNNGSNQGN